MIDEELLRADLAELDPEQLDRYLLTRALAREQLRPLADSGADGAVNRPLVRELGKRGLLARIFCEVAGRFDPGAVSALELCLTREALACECTGAETAFALQGLGAYPILLAGRPELVERWIPAVAAGEAVAAFALTEPNAGSDVSSLELAAARDGAGWRLSGTKTYISNAPDADLYAIFARTAPGSGSRGMTAFAVARDSVGLHGERLELLAPHPIGRLALDSVFVPADHVLGEVNAGFRLAMRTLDLFRPSVGAFAVGMAQAGFEAAAAHADQRHTFGKKLREHQAVAHLLAEMATRLQAARLLVHSAARMYDRGLRPINRQAAMAKLFATEAAQFVVDAAVQIYGAAALERGHLLEHLYREVRAPRIYEGASEIQREIISRELYRR